LIVEKIVDDKTLSYLYTIEFVYLGYPFVRTT